jgi:hypothetical protein
LFRSNVAHVARRWTEIVKSQGITVNLHTRHVSQAGRTTRFTDKELYVFFHLLMLARKSIPHDVLL